MCISLLPPLFTFVLLHGTAHEISVPKTFVGNEGIYQEKCRKSVLLRIRFQSSRAHTNSAQLTEHAQFAECDSVCEAVDLNKNIAT